MAAMLGGLEGRFNSRMDASDNSLHTKIDKVDTNLGGKILDVSCDLERLKRRVVDNERGLDGRIESVVSRMTGGAAGGPGGAGSSGYHGPGVRPRPTARRAASPNQTDLSQRNSYKDERYWRSRRSLRIWPIRGPDLRTALSDFLINELQMDPEILNEVPNFEVRRVRATRSKIEDEVIVLFPDVETRDGVRSAAPRLAGNKDAGVRLEVPEFLRPSLRSLESAAYLLKQAHPGLKRNLKFDDEVMDLVMDVRLAEGSAWKKIRPGEAAEAKKGRALPSREGSVEMDSAELQSLMSQGQPTPASGANAMSMIS